AGFGDSLGIAQPAIGHDPGTPARPEASDKEIARRSRSCVAPRIDDEDVTRRALLHRLLLQWPAASGSGPVPPARDETPRERKTHHTRQIGADWPDILQKHIAQTAPR